MRNPDQHLEWNYIFEIFFLPNPNIGHFKKRR